MQLKQLKNVVKKAINEEKDVDALRNEVSRVLGPIMITDVKLESLAEAINDRVEVMNRTGRESQLVFKPSVVSRFMNHPNGEVRKMAANLLPSQLASRMAYDSDSGVRAVIAKKLAAPAVKEMMKKFPHDDELRLIYTKKSTTPKPLNEDGLPNPKKADKEFDMYGEPLGDAVKQPNIPELSDTWYYERSAKFLADYGDNIEYNWEEILAKNYCNHIKATSGVEVDQEKMLKAIKDRIKEKKDRSLERNSLRELASSLRRTAEYENLNESLEDEDPVYSLVESRVSSSTFIEAANKLFNVREATLPSALRKFGVGKVMSVPMKARVPHGNEIRAIDEQAFDAYVKHWNEKQMLVYGEPIKIDWYVHPTEVGVVGFKATLR